MFIHWLSRQAESVNIIRTEGYYWGLYRHEALTLRDFVDWCLEVRLASVTSTLESQLMDNSDSASKESKKTQDGNGSKELSGLENEPGEGSCEDENEDDETGVNPLLKSVRYLEKHRVIRLFQVNVYNSVLIVSLPKGNRAQSTFWFDGWLEIFWVLCKTCKWLRIWQLLQTKAFSFDGELCTNKRIVYPSVARATRHISFTVWSQISLESR